MAAERSFDALGVDQRQITTGGECVQAIGMVGGRQIAGQLHRQMLASHMRFAEQVEAQEAQAATIGDAAILNRKLLKGLEPPTTSFGRQDRAEFPCNGSYLFSRTADRANRPAASTSSRVDGITPATMLQSGSNWTTDSISQGDIDAVTSRRTTPSDVRGET